MGHTSWLWTLTSPMTMTLYFRQCWLRLVHYSPGSSVWLDLCGSFWTASWVHWQCVRLSWYCGSRRETHTCSRIAPVATHPSWTTYSIARVSAVQSAMRKSFQDKSDMILRTIANIWRWGWLDCLTDEECIKRHRKGVCGFASCEETQVLTLHPNLGAQGPRYS